MLTHLFKHLVVGFIIVVPDAEFRSASRDKREEKNEQKCRRLPPLPPEVSQASVDGNGHEPSGNVQCIHLMR